MEGCRGVVLTAFDRSLDLFNDHLMDHQSEFLPRGLTSQQTDHLLTCQELAGQYSLDALSQMAHSHVQRAHDAYAENALVNVQLAEAINQVAQELLASFDSLPDFARSPVRGAIYYFISDDDVEPDFGSPIGFEDDVDVLNACLELARRSDLRINAEDYDDA